MSGNGLVTIPSAHGVQETIDRVEGIVKAKGLTVFARVDHAAGAKEVGLVLAPTLLLIFGNARGGTPLMQANQQVGIDLPLKVLAWQDGAGKTWLCYNDPQWIAQRHGLGHEVDQVVKTLSGALVGFYLGVRMQGEAQNETCRACGACCAYSAEWPRFSLETEADLDRIPRAYVDEGGGRMRCEGDRCAALAGEIGVATSCAIYAARPQVCRACLPGDDACRAARRSFNLVKVQSADEARSILRKLAE